MQRVHTLIWIVLIALLILGTQVKQYQAQKMTSSRQNKIRYLTIRGYDSQNTPAFSLAPANSDQVDNQTILNSLVSTLVKYGSSGKIEPYLAEKWSISEDSKRWQFFIKDGFSCESGRKINAQNFKESLLRNFRRNLEKSDRTDFSLLIGWSRFLQSLDDDIEGLTVINNSIVFEFENVPGGILNYLRMPYFGFWCQENFNQEEFNHKARFISSGPYKVERIISESRLMLTIREDQPFFNSLAPQSIEIGYGSIEDLKNSHTPTIGKIVVENNPFEIEHYEIIDGPPLILQGIVIHPNSAFFSNEINRKVFSKRLHKYQQLQPSGTFSKGFYLNSNIDRSIVDNWPDNFTTSSSSIKITLQYMPTTAEGRRAWEEMFAYIFDGIPYELVLPNLKDPNWTKSILNNNDFALRTSSVYAGARHTVSVIKMMFCSNLGISFPDPSHRICNLVDKYSVANREADEEFQKEFNRILVEDSVVFPLFHAKDRWLISDAIDIRSMPTSIIHPPFEKIRFR